MTVRAVQVGELKVGDLFAFYAVEVPSREVVYVHESGVAYTYHGAMYVCQAVPGKTVYVEAPLRIEDIEPGQFFRIDQSTRDSIYFKTVQGVVVARSGYLLNAWAALFDPSDSFAGLDLVLVEPEFK